MPEIKSTSSSLPPPLQTCENIMAATVKEMDGDASCMTVVVSPGLNGHKQSIVYTGATSFEIGAAPNNQNTLFGVGSNTKAFISAMIQALIALGLVNLDDPISKHMPDFFADGKYPEWASITVQQLLNMTSGITPDFLNGDPAIWATLTKNINKSWSPLDILNIIPDKGQTIFPAGSAYSYCNTNYLLLGQLLVNKVNKPIREIFAAWIESCGLTGKVYFKPEVILNDPILSKIWAHLFENGDNSANVNQSDYSSAGALIATGEGLTTWIDEGLYGGKAVTPAQLASMRQWVSQQTGQPVSGATEQDPYVYGLGIAQMWLPGWGPIDNYEGNIDGATAGWYRVNTSQGIVTFTIMINAWWTTIPKPLPVLLTEFLAAMGMQPDPQYGDSAKAQKGYPSVPVSLPGWGVCESYSWKVQGEKATWVHVPTSNMGIKTIVITDKDISAAAPKSMEQLVMERLEVLGAKPQLNDTQSTQEQTIIPPQQLSSAAVHSVAFFKPSDVDHTSSKNAEDNGCISSFTDVVEGYASTAMNVLNVCVDQFLGCGGVTDPEDEKKHLSPKP